MTDEARIMNDQETPSKSEPICPLPQPKGRHTALALAAILLIGVGFGLPSLPEPFGVDQGIYGYIAERLLEGAVGYRDVFDHKPPGIHVAYAAAFAAFGHQMWSVRLLDWMAALATAWCLCLFGRRWIGLRFGFLAGSLYIAYYETGFDWMSRAQPETWVNLAFVAALALSVGRRSWPATFAAGLLLGMGFWFKPTIVALAPVWIAIVANRALQEPENCLKRFELDLLAAGAGVLAACGLVVAYYAANGALNDLYEAVFVFNLRYHNRLQLLQGWRQIGRAITFIITPLYAMWLLAAASVGIAAANRQWGRVAFGWVWLVLAFATVFWQASFAKSHYVLVLPPVAVLAAFALDTAARMMASFAGKEAGRRYIFIGALTAGGCLILLNLLNLSQPRWTKYVALADSGLPREKYYASFWLGAPGRSGYSLEDLRRIGAYLEERTTPDQPIYIWGFRPLIAYLAHRRMPTRFIFRYPLTQTNDPRWWAEFLSDLERSHPVYFVVVFNDRGLYHPESSKDTLESNAALSLFLHDHYVLDRTMSDFEIWRLRDEK